MEFRFFLRNLFLQISLSIIESEMAGVKEARAG
jgi:hypothetical protein